MSSVQILVPVLTLLLHRRCVDMEDGVGILIALVGILLVTQPDFIFAGTAAHRNTPPLA